MLAFVTLVLLLCTMLGLEIYKRQTGHLPFVKPPAAIAPPRLSEVSKGLLTEYNALPEDKRPMPDIHHVLETLDERTGTDPLSRRRHFDDGWLANIKTQQPGGFKLEWNKGYGTCNHRDCHYKGYYKLHQNIQAVADALAEQDRIVRASKTDGNAEDFLELQQALTREVSLIVDYNRKFKELT